MIHTVKTNRSAVHGYFSRELEPVLRIHSGDTVRYENLLDARWHTVDDQGALQQMAEWRNADPLKGHALYGPIWIQDARKGMTLELRIDTITPAATGWNYGGGGGAEWAHWQKLHVNYGEPHRVDWIIDKETQTAFHPRGFRIPLAPFPGVLGMPPDEEGQHSTTPPRIWGGNLDCKLLVAGTSLFLPVPVDGGLVSVGDGHAVQGDGEVSGTAIECPLDVLEITYIVHENLSLVTPRARTHEGWITFGFDRDLDDAMYMALNGMLELMMDEYDISRQDALSLASVAVDLRVTQVVNDVLGVHAVLPYGAITRAG